WLNLAAPNSGLLGVPVGTAAEALRASGESPFFKASPPAAVKMPHLLRTRRLIWPSGRARAISARFARGGCAARRLAREAFSAVLMRRARFNQGCIVRGRARGGGGVGGLADRLDRRAVLVPSDPHLDALSGKVRLGKLTQEPGHRPGVACRRHQPGVVARG